MERISQILGQTIRRIDRPEATLAWLVAAWPELVGSSLAVHTRPVRCDRGRLDIATDAGHWAVEIGILERELCKRINDAWGTKLVGQVTVVAPSESRVTRPFDNRHTPFIRRSRA